MRKIHLLLFRTFIGPFMLTLFVTNFLLLMIWLWKWMEDIVGKGIEFSVIAELIGYASLNQVPLSLPLAILLSSIMTYGHLGETIELTAIKSAGISLWRAMYPLIALVVALSVMAFVFSNNILPVTNKKLKLLLRDVTSQKPELTIPEGVFYDELEGYVMRIGKKYPDKTLSDIIIFENKNGSNRFITADSGRMELANSDTLLVLTLINGNAYDQENESHKVHQQKSYPLIHNNFDENQIIFNLSAFKFVRSEKSSYSSNEKMKNVAELNTAIDSIQNQIHYRQQVLAFDLNKNFYFRQDSTLRYDTITPYAIKQPLITTFEDKYQRKVLHHAADIAKNTRTYIRSAGMIMQNQKKIKLKNEVEWHRKFTLSYACLLLFFLGAPFGAIVRKGGLGLPVIISVFLFLSFHVLSIVGEKLAKSGSWEAYEGMWMAALYLTPLGLFLTYKATTDSALFNAQRYKKSLYKLFGKSHKV